MAWAPGSALAVDGVVEINQARALKGGVTPGDTPGFPVTLSVSGSYRLTSNLTVPDANTDGIFVSADEVSIDLNGFAILGPVTCSGGPPVTACSASGNGIGIDGAGFNGITVTNGKVRGVGLYGIDLGKAAQVTGVTVRWAGNSGIVIAGGTVSGCVLEENRFSGAFLVTFASLFSGNVVRGNGTVGLFAQAPTSITANTIEQNGNDGIVAEQGSTILGNTIGTNTSFGIECQFASVVPGGAYAQNVLTGNNGGGAQVHGCVQLGTGTNVCNAAACP